MGKNPIDEFLANLRLVELTCSVSVALLRFSGNNANMSANVDVNITTLTRFCQMIRVVYEHSTASGLCDV